MFAEGLVAVRVKKKYGFIDRNGVLIIKPRFRAASNFSEGLASVMIGCSYGFIDASGRVIIKPTFNFVGSFSDGLAAAEPDQKDKYLTTKTGKKYCFGDFHFPLGYIDRTGKIIIEAKFEHARPFINGIAPVSFDEPWDVIGSIGRRGYIDKTGKYTWEPTQ